MKIIKFEQPNCKPCEAVDKFLKENGIEVEHVNAWEDPHLASKYRVNSCPTVLAIDNNNQVTFRSVGFKPLELLTLKNM